MSRPSSAIGAFWHQRSAAYRNFQIVFSFLTLHFFIPSLSYALTPGVALSQFVRMGAIFGVTVYPVPEQSYIWRTLAVGNVMTLAFMCLLLQVSLKRFYPVLIPLSFMKGVSSLGNLIVFVFVLRHPGFFLVFLWDAVNVWMFIYFSSRARAGMDTVPPSRLIPRLLN